MPITPMAVPREANADTRGRAMAKTEPKTSNRTIPARMIPSPVPPNDTRFDASPTWPATATCSFGPTAVWAVCTNVLAWAVEMFCERTSKVTVANPVLPSALTWLAPRGSNGLVMVETWGRALTLSSMAVTVASTDGSVTLAPSVVWNTICSRSPATAGAAACRRARALVDSVLGREKLLEYAVPIDWDSPLARTRAASHPNKTMTRCRTHQEARRFIGGDSSVFGSGGRFGDGWSTLALGNVTDILVPGCQQGVDHFGTGTAPGERAGPVGGVIGHDVP